MEKDEFLNKLRLQKGLHSYYEMKKKPISLITKALLIIIPAIITFLSISDMETLRTVFPLEGQSTLMILISLISIFLFLISVLSEVFGIQEKYKEHRIAINQLIKLRKNFQNEMDEEQGDKKQIIKKYNDIYIEIVQTFPEFTDSQYFKGKKYYLQRLKMKKILNAEFKSIIKNGDS